MVIKDLEIDDRLLALPYSIDVNDEGQIVLTPLQEPGLTWEQLATTHPILPEDCHWKIETNKQNQIFMSPPPRFDHQAFNVKIVELLLRLMPQGRPASEAGVRTSDGTRMPDVMWLSRERFLAARGKASLSPAPEICVEILSPRNTRREIAEKTALYFEAGALEVWRCERDGKMRFSSPEGALPRSRLCPEFPDRLDAFA